MTDFEKLAGLLEDQQETLLADWRKQVRELPSAENLSDPTLNDHIPILLEELRRELRTHSDLTIPEALANMSGCDHGLQRLGEQFDISEVVAEYNVLRGCIHDLAFGSGIPVQGKLFHILNRVLDGAIGLAVQTFASEQALAVRKQREEYLSFVVHDLRTPLSAISLAASVLEYETNKGIRSPEKNPLHLILRRNVDILAKLVDHVLEENISLVTETTIKVNPRSFELWPLVQEIVQSLVPISEVDSCRVTNDISYELMAYGDANLLRRVFRNLIANAIKYTPGGGVEIGALKRGDDGAIECWVKDTGTGIPAERLESVFDKLETDPDREDGKGLGLSIVKAFIESHDGEVTVDSKVGVGTTFHFYLPGPPPAGSVPAHS